ncbi:MAG: CHAT domain-containing protein [Candidatus Promineifilaceae bacterium]|nr:CHAT domain-containing protein [Candidatus Promineifilaceae bacterium]
MSFLTRKQIGYAHGLTSSNLLSLDIDRLDALYHVQLDQETGLLKDDAAAELLEAASELETEARELNALELLAAVQIRHADILLATQALREAIVELNKTTILLRRLSRPDYEAAVCDRLADTYRRQHDWHAVLQLCAEGISLVESQRYNVSAQYLQGTYLRSRIKLYANGVYAAYKTGQFALMLKYAELSKARAILRGPLRSDGQTPEEQQTEKEFKRVCRQIDQARALGDDHVLPKLLLERRTLWDLLLMQRANDRAADAPPLFDLDSFIEQLKKEEAVLYYYWLNERQLLVVYLDRRRIRAEIKDISDADRQSLRTFTDIILGNFTRDRIGYLQHLNQLKRFAQLVLPIQLPEWTRQSRSLLISPHKMLHAFPFQALPWDEAHDYLVQRLAVTYIPNLSSRLLKVHSLPRPRLLALGIAEYRVPGKDFPPLRRSEEEVVEIAGQFKELNLDALALAGHQASEKALRKLVDRDELSQFSHLHFSTHGESVSSDNPMESNLVLHETLLDGLEIANWRLNAELVVLSACCSGQRAIKGRPVGGIVTELPGDDVYGLQAAFYAAGAQRVLGAMWPVAQDTAHDILSEFYRLLLAGREPEFALQESVCDYIVKAGINSRKPYFWAPFFISAVGQPTATV